MTSTEELFIRSSLSTVNILIGVNFENHMHQHVYVCKIAIFYLCFNSSYSSGYIGFQVYNKHLPIIINTIK